MRVRRKTMKIRSIQLLILMLVTGVLTVSGQTPNGDKLRVGGLQDVVTVTRDSRGIPYIEAKNDHDLYFAQGYITATDRLWQMDVLRRTGRGELAEIFGKSVLDEDIRHRNYGFAHNSEIVASKMTGEMKTLVQAYADGINAYIASLDEKSLPVEFRILQYKPRNWTPADTVVIGYIMLESLTNTWQMDLMRASFSDLPKEKFDQLFPEYSALDTPVVGTDKVDAQKSKVKKASAKILKVSPDLVAMANKDWQLKETSLDRVGLHAEYLAASNNWVVSGKKTVSGKPLLSSDPHLALAVPPIWYLVNLSAPGVRVAGVSIPGIHCVIIGHNDRIAWGMTNIGPDVQDLYKETFDQQNRYLTPQGWKDAEVRSEIIKVRKVPTKPETEDQKLDVVVTRHGPIVIRKNDERYALRWTAFDTSLDFASSFHKLNRAKNWKDFTAALSTFAGAPQNHVYADVDGHIGYYGARYVPIRKNGDGSVPYDGSKDDGEWVGYIPFEKMPHVFDPPKGYIATANARIIGKDYPYFLTHAWSQPYRQKRINDLLSQNKKFSIDDFRVIQGDDFAIGGKNFADAVQKLFSEKSMSASKGGGVEPPMAATLKSIAEWDGRATPESHGALLVNEWRQAFINRVLNSALGVERAKQYRWGNRDTFIDYLTTNWPKEWLPKEFTSWKDLLIATENETRENLTRQFGSDESKWKFGNAVQIKFNHPLAIAPMIGGQFKIDPLPQRGMGYGGGVGPTVNVGASVSMRLIADLSNLDNTQHTISVGQSGNPKSPHFKDQIMDWYNVTPPAFPFTKEAVRKAAKETLTLVP